jgi:hypothetical protein
MPSTCHRVYAVTSSIPGTSDPLDVRIDDRLQDGFDGPSQVTIPNAPVKHEKRQTLLAHETSVLLFAVEGEMLGDVNLRHKRSFPGKLNLEKCVIIAYAITSLTMQPIK